MICRSSWISTQKRTPSGVAAPDGVFLLVLTALAHQAVKPPAQIIGYYLCSDRLKKCDDSVHGLPPPFRDWGIGEGPQCQYNTCSNTIQQKAPRYCEYRRLRVLVLGECLIPGFDHVELRCPAFGLEGVCALGLHDALLRFPSVGGDFCCYFSQIL